MDVRNVEEIPEFPHWCLLLVRFVSCSGRCDNCSVGYLKTRHSVVGGC